MRYDEDEDARFGILLTPEETAKLVDLCNYMGKTPYEVVLNAINKLHSTYLKQVRNGG